MSYQLDSTTDEYVEFQGVRIWPLQRYRDQRGWLVELYRSDELAAENHPVMGYASETCPGVARGPHEHLDQSDFFIFLGPGDFRLYLWDARPESATHGRQATVVVGASNPSGVIIPPGVVHAYKSISEVPGLVLNFPNRLYRGAGKREPVDEIRHETDPESCYQLDTV
jgi:dTDP-4-dehydrorhamnose 3,5-epimerase-like enzyme